MQKQPKQKSSKTELKLIKKADEYLKGWKQAQADLDNYRKRMDKEAVDRQQAAKRELVEDLLSLLDNFQALTHFVPEDKKEDPWVQGVLHVARQFDQTLEGYGLTSFSPAGEEFNPDKHEAIEKIKQKGKQAGLIAEVIQPGYILGETLIRPAKVKVTS